MITNARKKMKKKIRQSNFSARGKKKEHFGIHRRFEATELRRCNDHNLCFNRTFWDIPTLRSYSVGAPTL
jgi:hypothetical protein